MKKIIIGIGLSALLLPFMGCEAPVESEEPLEEEIEIELEVETETVAVSHYEDDYIAFDYPEGLELLYSRPSGGREDSQGIEFLSYNEERGAYISTNLHLSYMVDLGESNSIYYESVDEIISVYEDLDLEMETYDIQGRTSVKVVTGDMSGDTFFMVIPAEEPGDAYRLNGAFYNEETLSEIIQLLEVTAELKR